MNRLQSLAKAGAAARRFSAFRTTEDQKEQYASLGQLPLQEGMLVYDSPGGSVTTFFAHAEERP